jgi:hypothetical protein
MIGQTRICTDHKNLETIFSPTSNTKQTQQRRLRWVMELQNYQYKIEHIAGTKNVWADLLSRWGALNEVLLDEPANDYKCMTIAASFTITPWDNFEWPNISNVRQSQDGISGEGYSLNELGLLTVKDRILITSDAMKLRLLVIAHSGLGGGHQSINDTTNALKAKFYWKDMEKDVKSFVNLCLHCCPTKGGGKIPRPLGSATHGSRPGQVIHFDYLYMQGIDDSSEPQWLGIIRDDFSGMVRLSFVHNPNSDHAAEHLLDWMSCYGTPEVLVTDQTTYFTGNLLKRLTARKHINHHLVIPYIHYSNGTVEVICKLVLQAVRVLLSELRWEKKDWKHLVPSIQYYLNHKVQTKLVGRAPIEVMSPAIPRDNPLDVIFKDSGALIASGTQIGEQRMTEILDEVEAYLPALHKEVKSMTDKQRRLHKKHADKVAKPVNFGIGDFVLIARDVDEIRGKLYMTWRGPYKVIEAVHDHIYRVQDIVHNDKVHEVHVSRMCFYSDGQLDVTEKLQVQKCYDDESFVIDKVLDHRESVSRGTEVLIHWKGFSSMEDTWEPLAVVERDAPGLWKDYMVMQRLSRKHGRGNNGEDMDYVLPTKKRRKR